MLTSFSASSGNDQELLFCWPPFPSREKTMQTPLANKYNIWQCEYSVIRKAEGWYLYHLLVSVENGNFSFLQRSVQSWAWTWAYGSALRLEGRVFGITLGVDWAQLNQGRRSGFPYAGPQVQVRWTIPMGTGSFIQLPLHFQGWGLSVRGRQVLCSLHFQIISSGSCVPPVMVF